MLCTVIGPDEVAASEPHPMPEADSGVAADEVEGSPSSAEAAAPEKAEAGAASSAEESSSAADVEVGGAAAAMDRRPRSESALWRKLEISNHWTRGSNW